MYTHARQFPHLSGMSDADIRLLARRAMARRPAWSVLFRCRNIAIVVIMIGIATLLISLAGWRLGESLMLAGAVGIAMVLCWNIVWVNTVLYQLTKQELALDRPKDAVAD